MGCTEGAWKGLRVLLVLLGCHRSARARLVFNGVGTRPVSVSVSTFRPTRVGQRGLKVGPRRGPLWSRISLRCSVDRKKVSLDQIPERYPALGSQLVLLSWLSTRHSWDIPDVPRSMRSIHTSWNCAYLVVFPFEFR